MKIPELVHNARETWEDRRDHLDALKGIMRQFPQKWRQADKGQRMTVAAVAALCVAAIAILLI